MINWSNDLVVVVGTYSIAFRQLERMLDPMRKYDRGSCSRMSAITSCSVLQAEIRSLMLFQAAILPDPMS